MLGSGKGATLQQPWKAMILRACHPGIVEICHSCWLATAAVRQCTMSVCTEADVPTKCQRSRGKWWLYCLLLCSRTQGCKGGMSEWLVMQFMCKLQGFPIHRDRRPEGRVIGHAWLPDAAAKTGTASEQPHTSHARREAVPPGRSCCPRNDG